MDKMVEQVVKRKKGSKDFMKKALTIVVILLLLVTCYFLGIIVNFYFFTIGLFILIASIYVVWYIFTSLNVEFEYSIVGGTINIAKIIAKRKRKRILNFEASKIEDMKEYHGEDFDARVYSHVYDVRGAHSTDAPYVATLNTEKHGRTALIFNPSPDFLEAMKPHLPRQIVVNLFYKR